MERYHQQGVLAQATALISMQKDWYCPPPLSFGSIKYRVVWLKIFVSTPKQSKHVQRWPNTNFKRVDPPQEELGVALQDALHPIPQENHSMWNGALAESTFPKCSFDLPLDHEGDCRLLHRQRFVFPVYETLKVSSCIGPLLASFRPFVASQFLKSWIFDTFRGQRCSKPNPPLLDRAMLVNQCLASAFAWMQHRPNVSPLWQMKPELKDAKPM